MSRAMNQIAKKPRLWLALLFAAMLLLGFFTAGDYGVYCDQLSEQVILRENLKEYAARLGDEAALAFYDGLGVDRVSESIEIDHGQCLYYPLAPWMNRLTAQGDTAGLSLLWHGYGWALFVLGVWALYGLLRETGMGRGLSLCGMLTLFLSPRFFAEGHYNNKDMALLALTLGLFWLGLRFLKRPTLLWGVLFSLAGAMAANTKIVGLLCWGLLALCAVAAVTARRQWSPPMALTAAATALTFAAAYALLTPAMWGDPAGYFGYLLKNASGFTRWPGVVVFRGMVFEHKLRPLPRYYLPYMILTTLPLWFAPLAVIGQVSALRRLLRQKTALFQDPVTLALACATVLWAAFVGYVALARPLIYNGWRHFYFLYAGMALLACWGLRVAWEWLKARGPGWRRAGAAAFCGALLCTALGVAINHPYQYAYYNPLARTTAETNMELDYWDVSTVNAVRKLLTCHRNEALPLTLGARDDMSWFGLNTGRTALTPAEQARIRLEEDENAPYLYVNTTYGLIYGVQTPPEGYHELFSLESYGNVIGTVYERD